MSQQSFADLGVSARGRGALAERGITEPFAIQKLVIADVLAGRDVLAKSPTGSGKTLAFGVPIVDRIEAERPRARPRSILAPTRELASQIVEELRADRPRPRAEDRRRLRRRRHRQAGARGRARAHRRRHARPPRGPPRSAAPSRSTASGSSSSTRPTACSTWASARPSTGSWPQCPRERQTLFFSATLDGEAGTRGRASTRTTRGATSTSRRVTSTTAIEHRFVAVERDERIDALVGELRAERELALVFVRTKRGADRLVKRLSREGVDAVAMHGDKSQRQRERALAQLRGRQRRHARRHRRGRARHRRRRDLARHQLRPARGPRRLRAPHRAHRPRGAHRRRHHLRRRRAGAATSQRIAAELELDREFAVTALNTPTAGGRRPPSQQRPRSRQRSRSGRR